MIPETILLKAAKPMIDSLISKIIKPKIDKFVEECKLKYDELLIPRGEHFEEYLYRAYKKYSILNTLVFKNEQRYLKELYIPLTIVKEEHHTKDRTMVKMDKYPAEVINEYDKILITDTAGMGKSTLTKYLFLDVIENGHGIPIYIEMRRLAKDRSILQDIQEQINSLSKDFDHALLLRLIQTGGFVFFLDGYDEIPLGERSVVTTELQDFISKASNNIFIMTSRPEQALACFGDFQRFSINSLTKKEAYELLRKYDYQGTTSKRLIDELKTGQYEMINEFLKNPLLVSLLFAAFDYKHTIPLKKHIFYRQVYDAYFDSHDLSKGDSYIHDKSSGLDIDDFERVLRFVGYKSLQHQKIEFDKTQLLEIIDEAKTYCLDIDFCSSNFLNDILTAVPLFCLDGQYYKWVHKSLQEYFAAQFIFKDAKGAQDGILTALYNSHNIDQYINVLDLYYDIDNWGFRKCILLPFCKGYVTFYETLHFASSAIDTEDINYRIGKLYLREVCLMKLGTTDRHPFPIKQLQERAQAQMGNNITSITCYGHNDVCMANADLPQIKVYAILRKRLPHLMTSIPQYDEALLKYNMSIDTALRINAHTGEANPDEYRFINIHLHGGRYNGHSYLNYSACKREVEKITLDDKAKSELNGLIAGL